MSKIAITGASGLIGSALVGDLRDKGHEVLRLVRRPVASADEVQWDPKNESIDIAALAGVNAVINLAGAGVGERQWRAGCSFARFLDPRLGPAPLAGSGLGIDGDRRHAGPGAGL